MCLDVNLLVLWGTINETWKCFVYEQTETSEKMGFPGGSWEFEFKKVSRGCRKKVFHFIMVLVLLQ